MDYEQNNTPPNQGPQQPEQPPRPQEIPILPAAGPQTAPPARRKTGWRIFWGVILGLSVLANITLFLMLVAALTLFAIGEERIWTEDVIEEGPRTKKIAVVRLEGIIEEEQAADVREQLKRAREDRHVKGIILRVNSPGGTISGSDQIHHEIKDKTEKPVVAFMQGVAASGGYYTSVACDRIVAEPTAITGSIGVIAGYLVLENLLNEKLGIQPVIVKSAERKDWPSSFRAPSDEEIEYLQEKLIKPAHDTFKRVVAEGRSEVLDQEDVDRLADGSIFVAEEAMQEKLVDEVGYLDTAIALAKELAGIEEAQVIEYTKPFSFSDLLGVRSNSLLHFDRTRLLWELSTPQVLYLWTLQK
jgi:protease-4